MNVLVSVYWQICTLRLGPDVLPRSGLLVLLALGAHWAVGTLLEAAMLPPRQAVLAAVVATLIMVGLTHALLLARGKAARTGQTVAALGGCDALIGILAWPLMLWMAESDPTPLPAALAWLGFMVWGIAIHSHILRHALGVSPLVGVAVALGYRVVALTVFGTFFYAET
ncbi:hypothetical protein HUS23_04975 [Ectothiorhodospiraceae bacterium 2226]|nr:hypothetical protein HUS23_04975 [Ectothiorhodospiraceae bacterium 2226]